jgi:N-methylhydantoinase A
MSEPASIRIGVDLGTRHAALVVQPLLGPLASALVELPEPRPGDGPEETAQRLAAVVEAGLRLLGESPASRELTLVSSGPGRSIVRGDGGTVALLATEGFTDLLRPELGQLASEPALGRGLCCLPVPERVGADGQIVRALSAGDAAALREQVRELGASAVAVALLHSFREPRHEQLLGQSLAGLGVPIALASELLPQPGELLRASAAVLDAHAAPTFRAEAQALGAGLGAARLRSVLSDGTARVEARPLRAVHSEAVAALLGVQRVAAAHELVRWIGLGIGAELVTAAVHDGGFERCPQSELGGLPLALPGLVLAIRRAGAEVPLSPEGVLPPGAAGPSLLDAARALGRLPEDAGRSRDAGPDPGSRLDPARAEALWEAAVLAATATVREASIERGYDPAEHTLICHGGAGPLLGAVVAERLGITRLLVPPVPGHMGALGALCAQCARERVRYLWTEASGAQQGGLLESTVRSLSEEMQRDLRAEGLPSAPQGSGLFWAADLRYQGQAHELTLHGIGEGGPAQDGTTDLVVRFHQEHRRRYGFTIGERPIELVAVRVRCAIPVAAPAASALVGLYGPPPGPPGSPGSHDPPDSSDMMMRAVSSIGPEGGDAQAAVLLLHRQQLQPGETLGGPLLIVEPGASTYVPPGWRVTPSELGALWLQA